MAFLENCYKVGTSSICVCPVEYSCLKDRTKKILKSGSVLKKSHHLSFLFCFFEYFSYWPSSFWILIPSSKVFTAYGKVVSCVFSKHLPLPPPNSIMDMLNSTAPRVQLCSLWQWAIDKHCRVQFSNSFASLFVVTSSRPYFLQLRISRKKSY